MSYLCTLSQYMFFLLFHYNHTIILLLQQLLILHFLCLEKKIQELEADGIDVLSVDKSYEDNESNLRLSATITVTERIDSEVAVSSNEGSMTDGVDGESN